MEFKLEEFVANPTVEVLRKCKRAELGLSANSWDVHVSSSTKKEELYELLFAKLSERGWMGEPTPTVWVERSNLACVPAPLPTSPTGMNAEDLRLTLRIKEVEVRQRELEVETMLLKVRALCRVPIPVLP